MGTIKGAEFSFDSVVGNGTSCAYKIFIKAVCCMYICMSPTTLKLRIHQQDFLEWFYINSASDFFLTMVQRNAKTVFMFLVFFFTSNTKTSKHNLNHFQNIYIHMSTDTHLSDAVIVLYRISRARSAGINVNPVRVCVYTFVFRVFIGLHKHEHVRKYSA